LGREELKILPPSRIVIIFSLEYSETSKSSKEPAEIKPDTVVAVDKSGCYHIAYEQAGDIYYKLEGKRPVNLSACPSPDSADCTISAHPFIKVEENRVFVLWEEGESKRIVQRWRLLCHPINCWYPPLSSPPEQIGFNTEIDRGVLSIDRAKE